MTTKIVLAIIILAMLAVLIVWIIFLLRREKRIHGNNHLTLMNQDELPVEDYDMMEYPGDIPDIDYD